MLGIYKWQYEKKTRRVSQLITDVGTGGEEPNGKKGKNGAGTAAGKATPKPKGKGKAAPKPKSVTQKAKDLKTRFGNVRSQVRQKHLDVRLWFCRTPIIPPSPFSGLW